MTPAEHIPYRPSNGTEGGSFMCDWCCKCERDRKYQEDEDKGEPCDILSRTFVFDIDDPEYPVEWIYKDGQPTCTAFIPAGDAVPAPRCTRTEDMFG